MEIPPEEIKILKTINNIIELMQKLDLSMTVDESIQLDRSVDSIKNVRDNYASRNKICIRHEQFKPCMACKN